MKRNMWDIAEQMDRDEGERIRTSTRLDPAERGLVNDDDLSIYGDRDIDAEDARIDAAFEQADIDRRADFRAILEESTDLRATRTQLIRENRTHAAEIGAIAAEIGFERARARSEERKLLAAKGEQPTSHGAGGLPLRSTSPGSGSPASTSTDGSES